MTDPTYEQMTNVELITEARCLCIPATPGPWFPHATDDRDFMNARYVGTEPSEFRHDGECGMDPQGNCPADSDKVVAITFLQTPPLATADDSDSNTPLIAACRTLIPVLADRLEVLESQCGTHCPDLPPSRVVLYGTMPVDVVTGIMSAITKHYPNAHIKTNMPTPAGALMVLVLENSLV